ncbi:MAG: T9SS type A sorting domain-containing protein [Bacteroidota bacterium]
MKTIHISLFSILFVILSVVPSYGQWTQSALPLSNQITDVLSYGDVWYVATSNSGILQSQNFTNWNPSSTGIGTSDIRRIIASVEGSAIVLYASTANGVYRSTMLGYNWAAVNNGLSSLNVGDIFSDGTILLASTADGVFRSENYGQNWSAVSIGASNQTVRCFLKNGTDMLAGLANTGSYLYRSTDNGLTWLPYGSGMYEVNQLAKLGEELFAASGTLMYHSTDNGLSWSPASSGLVPGMNIMDMTTLGNYLYVATLAGGYVQHTDSSSFRLITGGMPMGGYMANTVAVDNEYVVFGTVSDGLWYAGPGVITSAVSKDKPEFYLYPNPVKDKCTVSLDGWQGKVIVAGVWDIYSRKVMDAFSGAFPAEGIGIDVSSLPGGIYFLRISDGDSLLIKKFIKQ